VFIPDNLEPGKILGSAIYRPTIVAIAGNYDDVNRLCTQVADRYGWGFVNINLRSYYAEGAKTVAFEIAEQLNWKAPDLVVAPVGDGCTLAAIAKGFRQLRDIGRTDGLTRPLGVQAAGMQPLVRRYTGRPGEDSGETEAASIKVRRPRNGLRLLSELSQAGGAMVAASDEDIGRAQRTLAEECGIVAEFTSAAAVAALEQAAKESPLGDKVGVIVVTGGRIDS
jgi:threonine synthase